MSDGSARPHCRSCGTALDVSLVDLGMQPISNAMRKPGQLDGPETFYPLKTFVCSACKLVQLQDFHRADELFDDDYTYFSSYSDSWLAHARAYVEMMVPRFGLGPASQVIELASNDGYLLQYFKAKGIPVLGVDPAANVAAVAEKERGIPTVVDFFGVRVAERLAAEGRKADLVLGNNVIAHVPDLNDFIGGVAVVLKPEGVATFEFPHLLRMIEANYFDTIYHEHYSYISLLAIERAFARHGLAVFDVEELATHGGSLRVFLTHAVRGLAPTERLVAFRAREAAAGLDGLDAYADFAARVRAAKRNLLSLLIGLKNDGRSIVGYGAPAKGNTLLNYCGIRTDFLDYTVDRSPAKQGRFLPGTTIPVHAPERIFETRPDYVLILPWNLTDEIVGQMAAIRDWGGRFIVPLPEARVLP